MILLAALVAVVAGCTDADSSSSPSNTGATVSTTVIRATTSVPPPPAATMPGAFAASGPISAPVRIGPPAGSALDGIDRDAGVSVRLRDGSTLWLFGDTARADDNGALEYFEIGTAAWAAPGEPTITRDVDQGGTPVAFATPQAGFPPCPGSAPTPGMWPSSAVVQPLGDVDRVIVWMENICLGSSIHGAARGIAVAEWIYDPARPPTDAPIRARILNQTLFPQRSFGLASLVDDDGRAIVYTCQAPEQGGMPEQYGPCHAAKVDLDRVADPTAYSTWTGQDFTGNVMSSMPLSFEPGSIAAPLPAGSFSVTKDPHLGRYVMVYSPWPGYSDSLVIRTATAPTGPWSVPTVVPLPNCSDAVGPITFWCYAASAQPIFSEPGKLGVGYYDRSVSTGPVRGSYLVATVPYDAAVPAGG
ncbi:MAG TPA: hypothetical protein PKY13_08360 [Microthrixaceae bacterium]|nr:hypothetical protein [Microthrixaceae bacterium]